MRTEDEIREQLEQWNCKLKSAKKEYGLTSMSASLYEGLTLSLRWVLDEDLF